MITRSCDNCAHHSSHHSSTGVYCCDLDIAYDPEAELEVCPRFEGIETLEIVMRDGNEICLLQKQVKIPALFWAIGAGMVESVRVYNPRTHFWDWAYWGGSPSDPETFVPFPDQ